MSKEYRCYDPITRHTYHSLDVTFLETILFFGVLLRLWGLLSSYLWKVIQYLLGHFLYLSFLHHHLVALCPRSSLLTPTSFSESGIFCPLVFIIPHSGYPTRGRRPLSHFLLSNSTNHLIAQYLSYQDLSNSYQSFFSQVNSVTIPCSVHKALQNPL